MNEKFRKVSKDYKTSQQRIETPAPSFRDTKPNLDKCIDANSPKIVTPLCSLHLLNKSKQMVHGSSFGPMHSKGRQLGACSWLQGNQKWYHCYVPPRHIRGGCNLLGALGPGRCHYGNVEEEMSAGGIERRLAWRLGW